MENYKNLPIHLLPTNNMSNLFVASDKLYNYHKPQQGDNKHTFNYELYITDDSKINIGDYFEVKLYDVENNMTSVIEQCKSITNMFWINNNHITTTRHKENCKKVIATTDNSLLIDCKECFDNFSECLKCINNILPKIPTKYIEHYISEYNKGNQPKTVDVLYDCNEIRQCSCDDYNPCLKPIIAVNSNNEITIKPVKETWSREEVIKAMVFAESNGKRYAGTDKKGQLEQFNNYINKNL